MKTIRAFIAVSLSTEAKQEVGRIVSVLAGRVPDRSVRWVKPGLLHVTLRFLGETAVSKLPAISKVMDTAAQAQVPLTLQLSGTGCFPNVNRPRVIWIGLAGQLTPLNDFKRDLDVGLETLGWAVEKRPFRPHLTVGRVKDAGKLRGVSLETDVREETVPVTAVHLIESQLTQKGPIYTKRHSAYFS
jgi:2'-5' RNA ligase